MAEQQLIAILGADVSQFQSAMRTAQSSMQQTASGLESAMNGAGSTVQGSTGKMAGAFKGVALAVAGAFAVDKIVDFGVAMVNATANAVAMNAQFSSVFGSFESQAQSTLDSISKESGVMSNRMKESFTGIASFAKVSGMDTADALNLSERAMRAVADSSAFYDRSLEDVTQSLQSFLKGNYENDSALGISSTETTRNAKANDLYGKSFNDLSESQKQLTLLSMVEEGNALSGALGQASRESDGLSNVLGNLKSAWQGFLAVLGEPVLALTIPIMKGLTSVLVWATEGVRGFFDAIKGSAFLESFSAGLSGIGDTLKTAFSGGGLTGVAESLGSIIPQLVTKGYEMIGAILQGITSNLPQITATIVSFMQTWIGNMATFYPMLLQTGLQILMSVIQGIITNLPFLVQAVITLIQSLVTYIVALLPMLAQGAIALLQGLVQGIVENLPMIIEAIIQLITQIVTSIVEMLPIILEAGIEILMALIEGIVSILPTLIDTAIDLVISVFKSLISMLPLIIDAGIELLTALIDGIVNMLPDLITQAIDLIIEVQTAIMESLPMIIDAGIELLLALIDGLIETIPQLVGAIPEIIEAIFNAFEKVKWGEIGKSIIQGIGKGITKNAEAIFGTVRKIASNLLEAGKKALKAGSPSQLFADEVGRTIPQGIALGIEKESDVAISAVEELEGDLPRNRIRGGLNRIPHYGTDNTRSFENIFNISSLVVREEADLLKLANELNRVMKRQENIMNRAGGRVSYGY